MDIPKNTVYSLSALNRSIGRVRRGAPEAAAPEPPSRDRIKDRRRQPDRRRRQTQFGCEDRRKRSSRRRPLLLGGRDARPVAAEDRRGSVVNTSA